MGSRCWGTQTMGSRSLNALIFSWAQLIGMFTAAARFLIQIGLSAKRVKIFGSKLMYM